MKDCCRAWNIGSQIFIFSKDIPWKQRKELTRWKLFKRIIMDVSSFTTQPLIGKSGSEMLNGVRKCLNSVSLNWNYDHFFNQRNSINMDCLKLSNSTNFSISRQFQRSELQSKIIFIKTWALPKTTENPAKKEVNLLVNSH